MQLEVRLTFHFAADAAAVSFNGDSLRFLTEARSHREKFGARNLVFTNIDHRFLKLPAFVLRIYCPPRPDIEPGHSGTTHNNFFISLALFWGEGRVRGIGSTTVIPKPFLSG